jgi:hypothetical protein
MRYTTESWAEGISSPLDHNNRAAHMVDTVVAHTAQEHPVQRNRFIRYSDCGFDLIQKSDSRRRAQSLKYSDYQAHVNCSKSQANNTACKPAIRFFAVFSQPIHTVVSSSSLINDPLVSLKDFLGPVPKPAVSLQPASPLSPLLSPPPQYLVSLPPAIILALNRQ